MPYFQRYSRKATQDAFSTLPRHFSNDRWLGQNNRYLNLCIRQIRDDVEKSKVIKTAVSAKNGAYFQVAQYIAASVPIHCLDGWSLLGKALACASVGDMNAAKHLGYYAELRAAFALLGAEGIGIFQNYHFTLEPTKGAKPLVTCCFSRGRGGLNGTHSAVSIGLQEWTQSPNSGELLAQIIRPEGISLDDWFTEFTRGLSQPWKGIGAQWLSQWGYDIDVLKDDKSAREESSYRPYINNNRDAPDLGKVLSLIGNIWEQSDLGVNYSFVVDLYLLRRSLSAYRKSVGMTNQNFHIRLDGALERLNFNGPKRSQLLQLLSMPPSAQNDPMILVEADKRGLGAPDYHIQLLARAALLLRIATGASNQLLQKAGIGRKQLHFWWGLLGESRGLWDKNTSDPIVEMWSDVETALAAIGSRSNPKSFVELRSTFSPEIMTLIGCERIALARLCL